MIYTALIYCSKNDLNSINSAKKIYESVLKLEFNNLESLIGLSRCYFKLNDFEISNKFIDQILINKPFHDTYIYFEEAYLIRSEIVSKQNNLRASQHFILLALELNKSSKLGWDLSAKWYIKNKLFNEAANSLNISWKLNNKSNPEIGYKLAYCLLKSNRIDESILICKEVLEIIPIYKDLKENILIPAYKKLKS